MVVTIIKNKQEWADKIKGKYVVANFWANWAPPCSQMNQVFQLLQEKHPELSFLQIDAEEVSDLSEELEVATVPTFLFLKDGKVVHKLEGANVPLLTSKVEVMSTEAQGGSTSTNNLNEKLKTLVSSAPIMLFMKGNPAAPRCGFSSKIVDILNNEGAKFSTFDILTDETVRQGLKTYSNWQTYPQLYVDGKLLGGLDIVKELKENGELADALNLPA